MRRGAFLVRIGEHTDVVELYRLHEGFQFGMVLGGFVVVPIQTSHEKGARVECLLLGNGQ